LRCFFINFMRKLINVLVGVEQLFVITDFLLGFEERCHFRDTNFVDEGFEILMLLALTTDTGVAAILDGVLGVAELGLIDFVELDEFIEGSFHNELETLYHSVFLQVTAERSQAVH
jgi:hypothetical protein